MEPKALEISKLQAALSAAGARWQARETPISQLSGPARKRRLGYRPGVGKPSLAEKERRAARNKPSAKPTATAKAVATPSHPAAFDWGNVGEKNFITPVRDQDDCGSCVAFGCIAAVEAMARITRQDPSLAVDLSEALLFYYYGEQREDASCDNGWNTDPALDFLRDGGVVSETAYPYTPGDQKSRCR